MFLLQVGFFLMMPLFVTLILHARLVGFRLFFCAESRAACAAAWAAASAAFCASTSVWDVLSLVTASRYWVSKSLIFLYAGSTATTGVTPVAAGVSAVSAVAAAVTVS